MSGDKRSVATDALETLGTIITSAEKRDAIHLAVEPVICGQHPIGPSERIYLKDGLAYPFDNTHKALGIADPFLDHVISPGQWFWLVVFPRQIKSLRHVWEHPDFPDSITGEVTQTPAVSNEEPKIPQTAQEANVAASKLWVENYAAELAAHASDYEDSEYNKTITYDELMDHAMSWVNLKDSWGGNYLNKGGTLEGIYTKPEFWHHFNVITGFTPDGHELGEGPSFFTCSC